MARRHMENYLVTNMGYGGINPLTCGQERCIPSHRFGPASRDYYLLHFVVSGKGEFTADGITHQLKASDCFLIKPHELTTYQADEEHPWHYVWVGFECEKGDLCLVEHRIIKSKRLGEIFRKLPEVAHMQSGREAYLCSKLWEIVALLSSDDITHENKTQEYTRQAISCIETEYMMDISVAEIAARLNLDRSYFSTLFKKNTGVSPQQYLSDFRLNKAAQLMIEYDYTVTQAALSTGYPDVFNFSKMFKRKFGVSPAMHKQRVLAEQQEATD